MPRSRPISSEEDFLPLYRLTCRGLICSIYRLITRSLRNVAREMVEEVGHGGIPAEQCPSLADELYRVVHSIWHAKWELHKVLHGDHDDQDLLNNAGLLIRRFEKKVVKPLARIRTFGPANVTRIRTMGRIAARIAAAGNARHERAEERFRAALTLSSEPAVQDGVVVSLDMARYSEFALDLERFLDARVLFEFNAKIQRHFANAIRSVGGKPEQIPIANTGDGAFVFLPNSELAVRFALAVQKEAFRRNLSARSEARRQRFRIGIAKGKYCLQSHRDVGGQLLGFSVAGVAIIDAARIQSHCPAEGILISAATFEDLPAKFQRLFRRSRPVPTKSHERRKLKVFSLKSP